MNLIIDVGNSAVKSAVFQDAKLLRSYVFSFEKFSEKFQQIKKEHPKITFSMLSSVIKDTSEIEKMLKKETELFVLGENTKLPFKNKYASPQTLGKDRLALVAAGAKEYKNKNLLIIDAGTCITFDFKNDKDEYLGGAISPGLHMRLKALHNFTAKLPLVELEENVALIGNSTQESILSGVLNGVLAELDGIIDRYRADYKYLTIILTGGDTQILSKRVKNGIFANPNFLLKGLNYILEFNKTQ
ncbi:type III pantothenate kinase [Salegentibacter salinarum]|uniref:Type III pantothenate kinase n=1 Tax=Salegentibacter salinarum TaxID=447422 RepID=A0A2N0TY90_9FLAO|nr:type III pantothenate kinase [Salegentibacter salinarum]PKD19715.1 type III pantothenate kinase [Salegentibacter salinarum]SKB89753.1 type III pantothenate kinase [Salegentibacter salinarum]